MNSDLVTRLQKGADGGEADHASGYSGGENGFTDHPFLQDATASPDTSARAVSLAMVRKCWLIALQRSAHCSLSSCPNWRQLPPSGAWSAPRDTLMRDEHALDPERVRRECRGSSRTERDARPRCFFACERRHSVEISCERGSALVESDHLGRSMIPNVGRLLHTDLLARYRRVKRANGAP